MGNYDAAPFGMKLSWVHEVRRDGIYRYLTSSLHTDETEERADAYVHVQIEIDPACLVLLDE